MAWHCSTPQLFGMQVDDYRDCLQSIPRHHQQHRGLCSSDLEWHVPRNRDNSGTWQAKLRRYCQAIAARTSSVTKSLTQVFGTRKRSMLWCFLLCIAVALSFGCNSDSDPFESDEFNQIISEKNSLESELIIRLPPTGDTLSAEETKDTCKYLSNWRLGYSNVMQRLADFNLLHYSEMKEEQRSSLLELLSLMDSALFGVGMFLTTTQGPCLSLCRILARIPRYEYDIDDPCAMGHGWRSL